MTAGPDGTLVPAGTGNRCFMLGRGYVELIAVTRPEYRGRLLNDLAHHEGLHLVSVGAPSARQAEEVFARTTGRSVAARRVKRLFRESGRDFTAEFAIVDLPDGAVSGLHLFAIEHLTRDAIWQPQLLNHPNGATALVSVTVAADERFAAHVAHLLDAPSRGGRISLAQGADRKSTRLNSSHIPLSRMPSSA